jgi:two-component system, NtrC family, nitrogen regulation sensor histidine kinase NtrY
MVYRRYLIQVILLQVILALTLLAFVWTLFIPQMMITSANLAALAIFEIIYLIWFINKTNRDLTRFFDAFQFQDGTLTFTAPPKKGINPLNMAFEKILQEFRQIRLNLESEKLFFQNALNHIGVGLLIVNPDKSIRFGNRTIHKMVDEGILENLENLDSLKSGFAAILLGMSPGGRELLKVVIHGEVVQLSIRLTLFRIDEELFRIFSFQDIKQEIEMNEAEAWQKLIRILTHEIMNSVSPITLTSSGLIQMLEKDSKPHPVSMIENSVLDNIRMGLYAIRKRSRGLASFVENYQAINHLPQPVMTLISVTGLFAQIEMIMKEDLRKNHVRFDIMVAPPFLKLHADERLISQILINLISNAIHALEKNQQKLIRLTAFQMDEQVRISVTDNGKGIPPGLLDSVFVPFFTTREKGSGIGLSLSREIMKLHGGGIRVNSDPGKETTFTLLF